MIYLEHRMIEWRHAASVQLRKTFPIERVKSREFDIKKIEMGDF